MPALVSTLCMDKLCSTEFYLKETHREKKKPQWQRGSVPEEQAFKDAGADREEGAFSSKNAGRSQGHCLLHPDSPQEEVERNTGHSSWPGFQTTLLPQSVPACVYRGW